MKAFFPDKSPAALQNRSLRALLLAAMSPAPPIAIPEKPSGFVRDSVPLVAQVPALRFATAGMTPMKPCVTPTSNRHAFSNIRQSLRRQGSMVRQFARTCSPIMETCPSWCASFDFAQDEGRTTLVSAASKNPAHPGSKPA